jgi:hypothetical protein
MALQSCLAVLRERAEYSNTTALVLPPRAIDLLAQSAPTCTVRTAPRGTSVKFSCYGSVGTYI